MSPAEATEATDAAGEETGEQAQAKGKDYCPAVYDEPLGAEDRGRGKRAETHTCDLEVDHDGLHHCDLCETWWMARARVREMVEESREQVSQARRDAATWGTGYVQVSFVDQRFVHRRLDPNLVTVKTSAGGSGSAGGGRRGRGKGGAGHDAEGSEARPGDDERGSS